MRITSLHIILVKVSVYFLPFTVLGLDAKIGNFHVSVYGSYLCFYRLGPD